jgi:hypothetical protein
VREKPPGFLSGPETLGTKLSDSQGTTSRTVTNPIPLEPALRKALKGQPSVEVRRRILVLLRRLDPTEGSTAVGLRGVRLVEVLEEIGSPEARTLLEQVVKTSAKTRLAWIPTGGPAT